MAKKCRGCGGTKPRLARFAYCEFCKAPSRAERAAKSRARLPIHYLLKHAKFRARKYGIRFTIEEKDLEIPRKCPVFGIVLKLGGGHGRMNNASASIDRIRPELGYVPGNVIVTSWRANRLKGDATLNEIQLLANFYNKFRA